MFEVERRGGMIVLQKVYQTQLKKNGLAHEVP